MIIGNCRFTRFKQGPRLQQSLWWPSIRHWRWSRNDQRANPLHEILGRSVYADDLPPEVHTAASRHVRHGRGLAGHQYRQTIGRQNKSRRLRTYKYSTSVTWTHDTEEFGKETRSATEYLYTEVDKFPDTVPCRYAEEDEDSRNIAVSAGYDRWVVMVTRWCKQNVRLYVRLLRGSSGVVVKSMAAVQGIWGALGSRPWFQRLVISSIQVIIIFFHKFIVQKGPVTFLCLRYCVNYTSQGRNLYKLSQKIT